MAQPQQLTARQRRNLSRQQALLNDAAQDIKLVEGEQILYLAGRHWIRLLRLVMAPVAALLIVGAVALFRAIGGSVLQMGGDGGFDFSNTLLAVALAALLYVGLIRKRKKKRTLGNRIVVGTGAAVLAALLWFRYIGGQIFAIDRFAGTPFDTANIILYVLAIGAILWIIYQYIDWRSDQLVLTNQRIVDDDEIPFIRHVQDQLELANIQNVSAVTNTYWQQWLNYGTVTIQSATADRKIVFDFANDPRGMQREIDGQLKKLRGQQSQAQLQSLIQNRVYGTPAAKVLPPKKHKETNPPFFLRWLLEENPEEETDGTIRWRPHWIFVLTSLGQPIALLLGLFILALIASRVGFIDAMGFAAFEVLSALVFLVWAAWEIEDHRNDLYILTITNVIDVEKKPFGPESRRTAGLGSIQNVTFKTTFWSQLLGYGDVFLDTAGSGGRFTFHHVPRAPEVVATVNEYLAWYKKGEKERNLNDTLSVIKTYHEELRRRGEIKS